MRILLACVFMFIQIFADQSDITQEMSALEQGCKNSVAKDCYRLGIIFEMQKNQAKAAEYYNLGCELGKMSACHDFAIISLEIPDAKKSKIGD
ncbi:hypothetical protein CCAL13119_07970 [Campylobacter sp. RM13119]|uniref:hypothetical protein n=1 Tax=Campylobacter californiensis TaxID=1032243 RepID=UPI001473F982|nr:hypothetical protein [Campylobacter sp. RM13119]MBE3606871.1 hypothetical protein [Campylobacter sp. RM13119]